MPRATEVGLGPVDTVLDKYPAPPKRGISPPDFSAHFYCGQAGGWIKMPLGTEVGLGQGHIVLDGDPVTSQKGGHSKPQFSAHVYCGQMTIFIHRNKWPPISATAELLLEQ